MQRPVLDGMGYLKLYRIICSGGGDSGIASHSTSDYHRYLQTHTVTTCQFRSFQSFEEGASIHDQFVHSEEGSNVNHGQSCICDRHTPTVSAPVLIAGSVCLLYHNSGWVYTIYCGPVVQTVSANSSGSQGTTRIAVLYA